MDAGGSWYSTTQSESDVMMTNDDDDALEVNSRQQESDDEASALHVFSLDVDHFPQLVVHDVEVKPANVPTSGATTAVAWSKLSDIKESLQNEKEGFQEEKPVEDDVPENEGRVSLSILTRTAALSSHNTVAPPKSPSCLHDANEKSQRPCFCIRSASRVRKSSLRWRRRLDANEDLFHYRLTACGSVGAPSNSNRGVNSLRTAVLAEDMEFVRKYCDNFGRSDASPLHLCVELNRPRLLNKLLRAEDTNLLSSRLVLLAETNQGCSSKQQQQPIMFQALRRPECFDVLLAHAPSGLLWKSDPSTGNTVLHEICRSPHAALEDAVLERGEYATKAHLNSNHREATILKRVLHNADLPANLQLCCNHKGENALHVACRSDNKHAVDCLLTSVPVSTALKMLSRSNRRNEEPLNVAVENKSHDAIHAVLRFLVCYQCERNTSTTAGCPVIIQAVGLNHLATVLALLEYPTVTTAENSYYLDGALVEATAAGHDDMVETLLRHGARPFTANYYHIDDRFAGGCALEVAVARGNLAMLTGFLELDQDRYDSRLQKEMAASIIDALVLAAESYHGAKSESQLQQSLRSVCVLLKRACPLDSQTLDQLRFSRKNFSTKIPDNNSNSCGAISYQTLFRRHYLNDACDPLFGSRQLVHMEWMIKDCSDAQCAWFASNTGSLTGCVDKEEADTLLVTSDGEVLPVHATIVSLRSAKLDAAIRFAKIRSTNREKMSRVSVNLTSNICILFLQHLYHGSLVSGLPKDPESICRILLSLLFVGEEFICPSMVQECEVRLLSCYPWQCICCFCCGNSTSGDGACVDNLVTTQYPSFAVTPRTAYNVCHLTQQLSTALPDVYQVRVSALPYRDRVLQPIESLSEVSAMAFVANFKEAAETAPNESEAESVLAVALCCLLSPPASYELS